MPAFDWDEANREHIAKHGFTPEDAEAVIYDPNRIRADTYNNRSERRSGVIGRGVGGDVLHVVFVVREGKIRPFHCRLATTAEKRRYRR
ncbi:MAG: BrnT family toxin [Deinococcota bacterium]|jgi:uncharacterized DUF497 family protein|nr:BrnT family toxin [Deinococcota bacterium]